MRSYFLSVLCLLLFTSLNGQGTNHNYFKLMVLNEAGDQMMLVDFKDQWEPAGRKYIHEASMRTILNEMAAEMGVEIKDHQLRAMITQYYGEAKHPVIFNYVTATYVSGTPTIPPGCKGIEWYGIEEGIEIIPFEGMQMVLRQVFLSDESNKLWGGSLHILTDPETRRKSAEILEDFYPY